MLCTVSICNWNDSANEGNVDLINSWRCLLSYREGQDRD